VEESEYKSTYSKITEIPCAFEKALTNQKAKCPLARHFWLADREGYACSVAEASAICSELLIKLRNNSRFVLKLQESPEKLPHNMEIRVQAGGLSGLSALFRPGTRGDYANQAPDIVENIHALVNQACDAYDNLTALPYSEIMQHVSRFQGRGGRKKSRHTGRDNE